MKSRIPSLDALRGLAILLVVIGHTISGDGNAIAVVGVQLFFVLSGFLITGLLVREYAETGTIALRRFYWRRATRLVPAYLLWLVVSWFLTESVRHPVDARELTHLVTWTQNYWQALGDSYRNRGLDPWSFGAASDHLWSLSLEEQFYVMWPVALIALTPRRATLGLVGFIAFVFLWRGISFAMGAHYHYSTRAFETTGDFLAFGCLLASVPRVRMPGWLVVVAIAGASGFLAAVRLTPLTAMAYSLNLIVLGVVLLAALSAPSFANPTLRWFGRISYSLYLWHGWGSYVGDRLESDLLGIAVGIVLACLSYYGMERFILRWRDGKTVRARPVVPA